MTTQGIDLAPPSIDTIGGISVAGAVPGNVLVFDSNLNLVPGAGGGGGGVSSHNDLTNRNGDSNFLHINLTQLNAISSPATASNDGYVSTTTQEFGGTKTLTISSTSEIEGLTIEGPIVSDKLSESVKNIAHAAYETGRSGFTSWSGSGAYWSWTAGNPGTFTLLRGGEGYVRHKEVIWAANQTLSLAYGEYVYVYIDASGILQKSVTATKAEKKERIQIGNAQNDAAGEFVFVRNNHNFDLDLGAREWVDRSFGTALTSDPGAADISRYTTGTGGVTTDRMVNITAGSLIDADLDISWSALLTGVITNHTYRASTGFFLRHSFSAQFPMVYNLAGTPTPISSGSRGVFRLFVSKDNLNSSTPQFISEMHTAQFGTLGAANTAIADGTISNFGAFNKDLAQVGYVVVRNNASGGYVESVTIEKTTFRQVTGGTGVGSTATNVVTNVTNFDKILNGTDTTVQASLETIDEVAQRKDSLGATILASTEKTLPIDADMLGLMDSAAANVLKKLSWGNIKASFVTKAVQTFPVEIPYTGTNRTATDQATLVAAITASTTGDTITITSDITISSTITVDKSILINGDVARVIQTASTGTDPVTMISVTANNVTIGANLTLWHKKTTNTSVETALSVVATGFVSYAAIKFVETGISINGSFSIFGSTTYVGGLSNSHRHIIIRGISAPSQVTGVVFDFPQETTARSNFILITSSTSTEKFNALLAVKRCMHSLDKYCRQFFLADALVSDSAGVGPALWFEGNSFNDLNGGIGFFTSLSTPLSFFSSMSILNNFQGNAAITNYKGILFLDGTSALGSTGTTKIFWGGNRHPTVASNSSYLSAYDSAGICYNTSIFNNDVPISMMIQGPNGTIYDTIVGNIYQADTVQTSGNQTIAGIKTFSQNVTLPPTGPLSQYEASNKKYVDDSIAKTSNNFVINPNGELSVTDSVTFGSDVVAPTIMNAPPLVGSKSFRLSGIATVTANCWWNWVCNSIDYFYAGRRLSFSVKTSAATGNAFKVSIYNVTDAIELTDTIVNIPSGYSIAKGSFVPASGKAYSLRVTQLINGINTCDVDDVYIYPSISADDIVGQTSAPRAGCIGERVSSQSATATAASSNAIRGIATLSIPTAGNWQIRATLVTPWGGASNGASIILSTTSASSSAFAEHGLAGNAGYSDIPMASGQGNTTIGMIPGVVALFSGAATIYLNVYSASTVSASGVIYAIEAVRIP